MNLTIKKIYQNEADQIGVYFPFDFNTKEKIKSLGARYSCALRCWYFGYNKENYNLILKYFENIIIEQPLQTIVHIDNAPQSDALLKSIIFNSQRK